MVNRYEKGKIYKITCDDNELVYYGSTCMPLSKRLSQHKYNYKCFLKGKYKKITSFDIVKYSTCKIELVEDFKCKTKLELETRERHFIENNECVNKYIPGQNREKDINEYNRNWYKRNLEHCREYSKKNYPKYKEKISKKRKQKTECECGAIVGLYGLPRHKKSSKHQKHINSLN